MYLYTRGRLLHIFLGDLTDVPDCRARRLESDELIRAFPRSLARSLTHSPPSTMSFGRPPSISGGFSVNPPDRGSFPLDHDGSHPLTLTPPPRATR